MAPTVEENDIAVTDLDREPAPDAIVLVASSHEAWLRHLQREQSKLIAQAVTGNNNAIENDLSELQRCIGKRAGYCEGSRDIIS